MSDMASTAQLWPGEQTRHRRLASPLAAWLGQTCDQPATHRVGDHHKDDWSRSGPPFQRCHNRGALTKDDVQTEAGEFCGILLQAIGITKGPAIFDTDVPSASRVAARLN